MQKYCQKDINRYMNTVIICIYVSMLYQYHVELCKTS